MFVDPFPVIFTVLPSVISDVLLVLLTIGPLPAGDSLLVNFILMMFGCLVAMLTVQACLVSQRCFFVMVTEKKH